MSSPHLLSAHLSRVASGATPERPAPSLSDPIVTALARARTAADATLPPTATFVTRTADETPTVVDTPAVPVHVDSLWSALHDWPVILR